MGVFSYLGEELSKLKTNFFQILLSFVLTVTFYTVISGAFHMFWQEILDLHQNLFYLRYLGPQVWKLSCISILQLSLLFIYKYQPAICEKYRYVKDWPWEVNQENWVILRNKTFWNYVINQLIVSPIMFYCFSFVGQPLRVDLESFPGIVEIISQVVIFDFINDFVLFSTHVILHWRPIYWIHKVHHEYYDVVSISGEYFHPIEFVINSIGTVSGPKLFGARAHIVSYFMWQMTRIWDNIVQNHSGYVFPWRPLGICPFQNGNAYHYWHHDRNIGNFSFNYNFWDRMFGFDTKFQEAKKKGEIKYD